MKAELILTDEKTGKQVTHVIDGATVKDIKSGLYRLIFEYNIFDNEDVDRLRVLKKEYAKPRVSGQQPKASTKEEKQKGVKQKPAPMLPVHVRDNGEGGSIVVAAVE